MKKIGIIGIGGRTGTMFYSELKKIAQVFGIGKQFDIDLIKNKKIFARKNKKEELLEGNLIEESQFPAGIDFDFLFLAVKNPVGPIIKYYYQKIKEKNLRPPALFLSQNGVEAADEAVSVLKEIFREKAKEISIFRISLFNPVDKQNLNDKIYISYSLPIKMSMAKVSGFEDEKEAAEIFKKAGFKIYLVPQREAKNMEYSKFFLNLIGMASATQGFSAKEGFSKREVFREEILAIKEYIKTIKAARGKFLNFPHYPVKCLSLFFSLPLFLLFPFRNIFGKLIEKGREGKMKDLDEVDYYNGAVVKLGEKIKIETPINKKILEKAKLCLLKE